MQGAVEILLHAGFVRDNDDEGNPSLFLEERPAMDAFDYIHEAYRRTL
jgi:hypothetical protein